jgi:hypothetical protein
MRLPQPASSDWGGPGSPSTDTDPYGIPAQDQPAQDQPAQDQPAQDQPAQDQPAQDQPAQDLPVHDIVPALAAAPVANGDNQRLLVAIGGGIVATAVVAALLIAGLKALSGSSDQRDAAAQSTAPAGPRPSASHAAPDKPSSAGSIDDERTDPRPLTLREVFPSSRVILDGHRYQRDMTAVNHQCELTARSAMAAALERARCRGVLRATFVQGTRYAVTTGVAIMPNRGAAMTANRAGDPSRYEWFRGMSGRVATGIDQAGGYAASTVRGRYIIYAYAQYADGTRPRVADPTLRALANQFVAYTVRPIDQRARG